MNPTTSAQALAQLESAQASAKSPDAIYGDVSASLGLPQAQQQVSGLRQAITNTTNLLNTVAPSVYGRTQNSLVTSSQAGRQIQNEEAPIQSKLSGLNTSEGNAASDLSNLQSQAGTLTSLKQSGQESSLTNLEDIYKNLYGQEQDSAAAALKKEEDAEQAREFNVSQQNSLTKSSSSGGLTATQQAAADKAAGVQNTVKSIQTNLVKSAGGDGYVSPQSYQSAANDFVQSGAGTIKDFNNYFSYLKNPANGYYFKV